MTELVIFAGAIAAGVLWACRDKEPRSKQAVERVKAEQARETLRERIAEQHEPQCWTIIRYEWTPGPWPQSGSVFDQDDPIPNWEHWEFGKCERDICRICIPKSQAEREIAELEAKWNESKTDHG